MHCTYLKACYNEFLMVSPMIPLTGTGDIIQLEQPNAYPTNITLGVRVKVIRKITSIKLLQVIFSGKFWYYRDGNILEMVVFEDSIPYKHFTYYMYSCTYFLSEVVEKSRLLPFLTKECSQLDNPIMHPTNIILKQFRRNISRRKVPYPTFTLLLICIRVRSL